MKAILTDSAAALRPVGTMLVVRRDDAEKMIGAIHLPSSGVDAPHTGTIIAVGPDVELLKGRPTDGTTGVSVLVGRRVAFTKYGGVEWDEQHQIMRQDDVMCFIEDDDAGSS